MAARKIARTASPICAETAATAGPTFTVVGIGASAGGLEALELFLRHVPPSCGLAFVVVQHLDPTHKGVMAELTGRRGGYSKGKGGSMHLFDRSVNFLGGHAIVGSHLPAAAGVGFAIKYQGGDQVCVCYFGDGAVPQGEFHESMNLVALWKLP